MQKRLKSIQNNFPIKIVSNRHFLQIESKCEEREKKTRAETEKNGDSNDDDDDEQQRR